LYSEFVSLNESQWGNLETDMWRKRKAGINPLSQRESVNISSDIVKVNSQVVRDHVMKEYSGSSGASHILNLGTRWR